MKRELIFGLTVGGFIIACFSIGYFSIPITDFLFSRKLDPKPVFIEGSAPDVIYPSNGKKGPFTAPFTEVKVGIFTYKVNWVDSDFFCGYNSAIACCSLTEKKITIRYDLDPAYLRTTVLHEVLHAVNNLYSNHAEDTKFNDEQWAETSPLILQVLRENPALSKFLLEDVAASK